MDSVGQNERPGGTLLSAPALAIINTFSLLLLACLILAITGCGGSGSNAAQNNMPFTGNWQFNLAPPAGNPPPFTGDPNGASALSVLQGGFLVQSNGSIAGQAVFSIWLKPQGGSATECNSGTAAIAGTVSGQTVHLAATVNTLASDGVTPTTQTFTLTNGHLSSDNSTIQGGTYSSTAGYYIPQGSTTVTSCGSAQSGVSWAATSIAPLMGVFQGFFHSTSQSNTFLAGQVFAVSGALTQSPQNIVASSATVTGTLTLSGYPCLTKASVNGQISGSSVVLQIFNPSSGSDVGQLGGLGNGSGVIYPVTFNNTSNGYVLQNLGNAALAYALDTSGCPGSGLGIKSGDVGNICLAFGAPNPTTGATACSEPITVTPPSVSFAPQLLASGSRARQLITLTNVQPAGSAPLNLSLQLSEIDSGLIYEAGGGDFNGLPNFTEQDTCGGSLAAQQSCTVSISFSPNQSCPWLPAGSAPNGLAPANCPGLFNPLVPPKALLTAALQITIPSINTPDLDSTIAIPIKGTGLSAVVATPAELDFGSEDPNFDEKSDPQTVTFTNQSANPVQILNALSGFGQACSSNVTNPQYALSRPPSGVPGVVVAATSANNFITPDPSPPSGPPTVMYYCDFVQQTSGSYLSSFQMTADSCSGNLLGPSGSPSDTCSVTIVFAPQPESYASFPDPTTGSLDYFLQLNTAWCGDANNPPQPDCEIDSGRFPVALTANPQGPLRMSPAAGLNFGTWLRGATSTPLTITLTNDQADNLTVTLTGKALTSADYLETDNCPPTLSSGTSCELTFTLTPSVAGFDSGNLVIGYNTSGSSGNQYNLHQYIRLRGIGQ